MYCRNCGAELREGAKFCVSCGTKVDLVEAPREAQEPKPKTEAASGKAAGGQSEKMTVSFAGNGAPESEAYRSAHPHSPAVLMSFDKADFQKPEEYRDVVIFFLLQIVTLGIYGLYQYYRITKLTNEDESMVRRGPVAQMLLCFFVPYYYLYWMYQSGKRIENLMQERTGKTVSVSVEVILFSLFLLPAVSFTILQSNINKYVGGITGQNMNADGIGTCKQCGCRFPNDVRECPNCGAPYTKPFYESTAFKVVVIILALIIAIAITVSIIVSIANSGHHSSAYSSYDYDYYYSLIHAAWAFAR